jgi:hypothetical protein
MSIGMEKPGDGVTDLRRAVERREIYLGPCLLPECITDPDKCKLGSSATGVDQLICQVWHKAEREQARSGSPGHHIRVLRALLKVRRR